MATMRVRSRTAVRVLIVDDHEMVVEALARSLARFNIDIVGIAASIAELRGIRTGRPDVVLMDFQLPDGTGADGCRIAKSRWPRAQVLILTGYEREDAVLSTLGAGADGFLLKSLRLAALVDAIRSVAAGKPALSASMLGALAREIAAAASTADARATEHPLPLTPRELDVLRLLANGCSTRTIAEELGMRAGTVRVHVEAIRRKFHATSRLEAVSSAIRHHVVEIAPV